MAKFTPTERVTLAALLSGLQSGVTGEQAMPLLSSVLGAQQQRIDNRRQMFASQMQALQGIAGSAASPDAGNAYLQSLIESGYVKPRMGERLTDFNSALYPSGGMSPLYGITGTPTESPVAVSSPQRVYSAVATTMSAIDPTTGKNNMDASPQEVYQAIVLSGDDLGWWAMQNPAEAMRYIQSAMQSVTGAQMGGFSSGPSDIGQTATTGNSGGALLDAIRNGPDLTPNADGLPDGSNLLNYLGNLLSRIGGKYQVPVH